MVVKRVNVKKVDAKVDAKVDGSKRVVGLTKKEAQAVALKVATNIHREVILENFVKENFQVFELKDKIPRRVQKAMSNEFGVEFSWNGKNCKFNPKKLYSLMRTCHANVILRDKSSTTEGLEAYLKSMLQEAATKYLADHPEFEGLYKEIEKLKDKADSAIRNTAKKGVYECQIKLPKGTDFRNSFLVTYLMEIGMKITRKEQEITVSWA